jgi:hypothetical protein
MKQILYIHGGESFANREDVLTCLRHRDIDDPFKAEKKKKWRESVREELKGTHILVDPEMPNAMDARYDEWTIWFEKHVPFLEDGGILIGHSLGANFLAKHLARHTLPVKISQLHLVAGCFGEGDFTLSNSLENIEKQCEDIFIYHSRDDDVVDFSDAEKFKEALPSAELVAFDDKGHFFAQEEFPELVERIKK